MQKKTNTTPLTPDTYFHIYNRGNGSSLLFFSEENYAYFLEKYGIYMNEYWDTFAYCLPGNHFHFLVKTKTTKEILAAGLDDFYFISKALYRKLFVGQEIVEDLLSFKNLVNLPEHILNQFPLELSQERLHLKLAEWVVSERFRRLMLSYAKAINRQEKRNGSLFQKQFKRKTIEGADNIKRIVTYIHRNPIHHGLSFFLTDFPWSSYQSMLSDKPTSLCRKQVLDWFGGEELFVLFHEEYVNDWEEQQAYRLE